VLFRAWERVLVSNSSAKRETVNWIKKEFGKLEANLEVPLLKEGKTSSTP
jgi:hypothetical protein